MKYDCLLSHLLNRLSGGVLLIGALIILPAHVYAEVEPYYDKPLEGTTASPLWQLTSHKVGENTERQLPPDKVFNLWVQDETFFKPHEEDRVEMQKVLDKKYETFKLKNAVPPIRFGSGEADIPESAVTKLREVLKSMSHRAKVRVHFVGHTDSDQLSPELSAKYIDNIGLSRARAEIAAEFFQRALDLPPESITYDGVGDSQPIASNNNAENKRKNRRVEVQVWYDEITEKAIDKEVVIKGEHLNRIKVCRTETVCKLQYRSGNAKRARLKNLVPPLRLEVGQSEIPAEFIQQINEVLGNLGDKSNVVVHFVGHTDNLPLADGAARIYRDHLGLSKARGRRAALAIQDATGLPNNAVSSTGKGSVYSVASNDSEKGRALNRRVEVEFWHDDPFQEYTAEPQVCPETEAAEIITLAYDPPSGPIRAIRFKDGQPVFPHGYTNRLKQLMDDASDNSNVRISFIGYTNNERMNRRAAMVYGDDVGFSTSRARRTMEIVQQELGLNDKQVEYEGMGYVHSKDVANTGFVQFDSSRVEVAILYDELAVLEENEGLDITRIDRDAVAHNPYALNLMRITVDGKPEYDPLKNIVDLQRCTDVALEKADIQFRFDNLEIRPRLNVTAWPNTVRFRDSKATKEADNTVVFRTYSNYPSFIKKSEIRLFEDEQSEHDEPMEIINVDKNGTAQWNAEFDDFEAPLKKLKYVLRVYDEEGLFDETRALPLWVVDKLDTQDKTPDINKELLVGYGESHLASQHIPLNGGTVLVNGDQIPKDHTVWIAGRPVPVNDKGKFVAEEIFSKGLHTVEVAVLDKEGNGELFLRDLEFKKNDWFYVGIADITLTKDNTNGPAEIVTGDTTHYDNDLSTDGRLAYYTDGKFGDDWQLTSSADTREGPLKDIFTNFANKSPDALFRRMDPDLYYPTFGDDSTVVENAPTSGKLFAKLKRHDDYGMWGNFKIGYVDTELAQVDRGLYGANVHVEADNATSFGEKKFGFDAYAAEPGTLGGRDEFRGTGGSLYFMQHQDINQGSDRVRIEIRDKDSGLVLAVKNLTAGLDYDIDYIQGRILLNEPLSSIANDKLLIDNGSFSGNPVYLVTRYEYTPGFSDLSDLTTGGRAHYWFNDILKLGLTSSKQEESDIDSTLNGADITLRKNAGTWLKIETATTEGQLSTSSSSLDGGFIFDPLDLGAAEEIKAKAQRVEASLRLEDIIDKAVGTISLYTQNREAGYSAPGQITANDVDQFGTRLDMLVTEDISLNLKADSKDENLALKTTSVDTSVGYKLDNNWRLNVGTRFDTREDNALVVAPTQTQGDRTDVAVEAAYDSKTDWTAYGFTQKTTKATETREENDRTGLGGSYRATDRLKFDSEISGGDTGTGAKLGADYLASDRTNIYMNYALDNERTDNGVRSRRGNLNSGFRSRYSDSVSIYGEERYTHGNVPTGLTHAAGVDLAPNDRWNFGVSLEAGTLEDDATGTDIERLAAGFNIGYNFDSIKYGGAIEYRTDDTETVDPTTNAISTNERITWLVKNSIKYQVDPSWRFLGKLNWSDSQSSQGEFFDGEFIEGVIGYGYRPVDNDRWNTLAKYTYFFNVPTTDQVTLNNTSSEYIQKNNIYSIDTIYDLTQRWSLGGKYAHRQGELSQDRINQVFFESNANLYILRADWHFVSRWDMLIEARMLDLPEAQDTRSGALLGMYRHVGKNLKFGIGYNFTDFSDDLTDQDFDSKGWFINLIGKI